MKRLLYIACVSVVMAAIGFAQAPQPQRGSTWYTPFAYVPNSATTVIGATTFLDEATLSNSNNSAVTCVFVDMTTNCGGSACQFWPTVSIAANQVYTVHFAGMIVTSGVQWSCSVSSVVVGQLRGAYAR